MLSWGYTQASSEKGGIENLDLRIMMKTFNWNSSKFFFFGNLTSHQFHQLLVLTTAKHLFIFHRTKIILTSITTCVNIILSKLYLYGIIFESLYTNKFEEYNCPLQMQLMYAAVSY